MLARLTHAAIAFATTAAIYQAYAAAVVRFVEPPAPPQVAAGAQAGLVLANAGQGLEKYRPLLAAYFRSDHWCFHPAVVIAGHEQSLLVFDGYEQTQSGRLRVPRCAMIFFPQGFNRGAQPPRDAIVLEPDGGAVLQMDQPMGANRFGRLQFGQLLGEVIVRSDMREPGPQDDLLLTTRDLYMNEDLMRTSEPVEMRLGANFARGRSLEIHFLPAEGPRDLAAGKLYGSLESLEILKEVNVTLAPSPAAPSNASEQSAGAASKPRARLVEAPVRIRTGGSLRIDFANYVASFVAGASAKTPTAVGALPQLVDGLAPVEDDRARRVLVRQLHPDGKLDELLAEELDLYFRPSRRQLQAMAASAAGAVMSSQEQESLNGSFSLEPISIEARGTHDSPVTLKAPSQEAAVRCEHLWIELHARRITIEGGEEIAVSFHGSELHAPMVLYQLPPVDSTAKVGELKAWGAGRFRAIVNPQMPNDVLDVSWKKKMELIRRDGQPVLLLDGRPRLWMVGIGELYGDAIELFLRERRPEEADPAVAAKISALPAAVVPQRLTASGRVTIDSAELACRVNQFDVTFGYSSSPERQVVGRGAQASPGAGMVGGSAPLFSRDPSLGGWSRRYDVAGVTLKVACEVRDRRPVVTGIRVDGGVVFQEQAPSLTAEPPLRITCERLHVARADAADSEIEIQGGGGKNGLPVQPAKVVARGATLQAPAISINRGTNRAWINSAGEIALLVSRDLSGQPLAARQPLHIAWEKSMELDQRRITFSGDVLVRQESGWLRTRRLIAQLTTPLDFNTAGQNERDHAGADLEQFECWEGVIAEFDQRDDRGLSSHQHLEVQSLVANQITGEIRGDGPGVVDSVHLSRGAGPLPDAGMLGVGVAPAQDPSSQLRHLHIEFTRGVGGNLLQHSVQVFGDVRTVYGPVAAWDDRLTMAPGKSPGPNEFWITCDQLGVVESPLARAQAIGDQRRRGVGPVEIVAAGRVAIEGEIPERGAYLLRGGRASYDQTKSTFMLEGDGVRPATMTHQRFLGAPPTEDSANKLFYNHATGEPRIEGLHKMEWEFFDSNKPLPPTTR